MFGCNIPYHLEFSRLRAIQSQTQLIPTPERGHRKVFVKDPIIRLRRDKTLIEIFVRTKVPPLEKKKGCCKSCKDTR